MSMVGVALRSRLSRSRVRREKVLKPVVDVDKCMRLTSFDPGIVSGKCVVNDVVEVYEPNSFEKQILGIPIDIDDL